MLSCDLGLLVLGGGNRITADTHFLFLPEENGDQQRGGNVYVKYFVSRAK